MGPGVVGRPARPFRQERWSGWFEGFKRLEPSLLWLLQALDEAIDLIFVLWSSAMAIITRTALVFITLCLGASTAVAADQKGVEDARPNGHPLLLDLHVPDGAGPFPAAILVHGGGFDGGNRATNMSPTFQPLADAGFAWFTIDYRMAPEFRFPEAKEDIDTAIAWVKANAATYKVDPSKIVLAGESAGGFLVNYAGTHETPATKVAAVVDIYGPVDYEKIARQRQAYPDRFNMTSINGHQKNGGSIWFFGADGL